MPTMAEQLEVEAAEYGQLNIGDGVMNVGPRSFSDWQNHVPLRLQKLWPQLSKETRLALYLTAQMLKHRMPDHLLETPKTTRKKTTSKKEVG